MKFTHKVTARNLLRYKKRFCMTVFGIAGCTGLLVTGFGLHDSISDIVSNQFGEIFTYDLSITADSAQDAAPDTALGQLLRNSSLVRGHIAVHMEKSDNEWNGEVFSTQLFVPQSTDQLSRAVNLRERRSQKLLTLSEDGVIITEKLSERAALRVGDTLMLHNADGQTAQLRIDAIAENYVENYVFLSPQAYEAGFHTTPDYRTLLVHRADQTQQTHDALSTALLQIDGISGVSFISDLQASFENMLDKINIIVLVLILSAGSLAFIVLYNLTNINITERTKELATIKVLGFFDGEVCAYVYRETAVLTIIGTLSGLVFGIFLHQFVIQSVEVSNFMFGRDIQPLSYVLSALLTVAFSALVNLVMHRRLTQISMVESMKAPE